MDYVNGIEYKNGTLEAIYHSEGRVTTIDGTLKYEYAMKDHLGNTRLMFCDRNGDGVIKPENSPEPSEVTQENSYYAFGMNMEFGAWENTQSVTDNLKQYNGKELNTDFGLNWNDYGARFYDPAIARWNVIDPMSERYLAWNPYNYVGNNPMKYVDPNGKSPEDPIVAFLENLTNKLNSEFEKVYSKITEVNEAGASFLYNKSSNSFSQIDMKNSNDGNVVASLPKAEDGQVHLLDYHAHINETEDGGFAEGSPPSRADVFNIKNENPNFVSMIETKNERFALVVTNVSDYKSFASGQNNTENQRASNMGAFQKAMKDAARPLVTEYAKSHGGSMKGFNAQSLSPVITKAIGKFLSQNKTGLGLYQSTNKEKTKFKKVEN